MQGNWKVVQGGNKRPTKPKAAATYSTSRVVRTSTVTLTDSVKQLINAEKDWIAFWRSNEVELDIGWKKSCLRKWILHTATKGKFKYQCEVQKLMIAIDSVDHDCKICGSKQLLQECLGQASYEALMELGNDIFKDICSKAKRFEK